MAKRPPIDLLSLTSEQAVPMTEAAQRAPTPARQTKASPSRATVEAATPQPPKSANTTPLNFRVSEQFRRRFRERALGADLKHNELLFAALDAWEREKGLAKR